MSYTVNILGQPITLPDTSASPNWAPGQVRFNQSVADALNLSVGAFDITPQIFEFQLNSNTDVAIPGLAFPTSQVRSIQINYYVYRTTNTETERESGVIYAVYDANGSNGNKWLYTQEFTGESTVSFIIQDTGQVTFSSTAMVGGNHQGKIGFYAKVNLQE